MIKLGKPLDQCNFDEFLKLNKGAQAAVVDWLTPIIDEGRQRGRKVAEKEAFCRTVGLVIANAIIAADRGVHYSRRLATYSGNSPYKPDWLGSRRLLAVIDGLAKEGLVKVSGGCWAGPFTKGVQSSYTATLELIDALKVLEVGLPAIERDGGRAPVIELKDENGQRVPYDTKDKWVIQRTDELKAYNAFIGEQDISMLGRETPRFCGLTRIYNDASWERGGRHYRGWWQNVPSAQRSGILINGEETVELDFEAFMTRTIYHLSELDYKGDPYDIPDVRHLFVEAGVDWKGEGRPIVKKAINILLNISSRHVIYKMKDEFANQKVPLKSIVSLIIEHHANIKDYFFKVTSPFIMNIESNICNNIILSGMAEGVVILPIFDSFITNKKHQNRLMEIMVASYKRDLGFYPIIH